MIAAAAVILAYYSAENREAARQAENGRNSQITDTETAASNLSVPWDAAFLPDGDILVTERKGTLKRFGRSHAEISVGGVRQTGEGGLLGIAIHPDFSRNHFIYLYLTDGTDVLENRIVRYVFENNELSQSSVILGGIPASSRHDGGRIKFGPDGYLYAAAGDSGVDNLAQDTGSLAGKILRIRDDGSIPDNNPFGNAVYAYGLRNPQGLAWDGQGRLWATDHGRSGALTGMDELNIIEKGRNYGWPLIQGGETRDGMVTPVINSGANETWAPSGAAFLNGSIFFGGLRGETLYEYKIADKSLKRHFRRRFGRIRAVEAAPDGNLFFTTSNTDGRGNAAGDDDKLIKVAAGSFENAGNPGGKLAAPVERWRERVTRKPFGIKVDPSDSPIEGERFSGYHTGTDFEIFSDETGKDVEIRAICSGPLASKSQAFGYGGVAVQRCGHGDGYVTVVYGHLRLSSVIARPGEEIPAGDRIGILGKGFSDETNGERKHLHLGIHKGADPDIRGYVRSRKELENWIDPAAYLERQAG